MGRKWTTQYLVHCQYCRKPFFAFSKLKKMTCYSCGMEMKRKRARERAREKKREKDARGENKK